MSVCTPTEEEGPDEPPAAGAPIRDIYDQKPASKVVRVLTVLAYLLSVSLAAILLSVYYVCFWQSPPPPVNDSEGQLEALKAGPGDYNLTVSNHSRGDNRSSTVSESPVNVTSLPDDGSPPSSPPTDFFPTSPDPTDSETAIDDNSTWPTTPNISDFNDHDPR